MAESLRSIASLLVLTACATLTSCAGELKKAEADLAQIEAWLPGRYDNTDQVQADAKAGRAPHAAQSLSVAMIDMQTFGEHVFYLQESAADDPRRITTQRLLSFEAMKDGGVLETLYTLTDPTRWRDGDQNTNVFKGMMYNDAAPLAGCELLWKKDKDSTKFAAENPAGSCRATVPALGGSVKLQMRAELTAEELSIAELAFNSSGKVLQGDAAEPFYRYRKRSGN
jgi:hypothetical protein